MELSFSELVVLSVAGTPKTRQELARDAARIYQSTKFDETLALVEIKTLEQRRFLQNIKGKLEVTREGWAAVMNALPVLESLRGAVAGLTYRVVR